MDPAVIFHATAQLPFSRSVFSFAKNCLERMPSEPLLGIPLMQLAMSRAALHTALLECLPVKSSLSSMDLAVNGLRSANQCDFLLKGLLSRSWIRALIGQKYGAESAQADLDEAFEIAEREPMRLHMADIHLYRARLFFREEVYPWNRNEDGSPRGPADDLAAAEELIHKCGYHRRDEELADAKKVIHRQHPRQNS